MSGDATYNEADILNVVRENEPAVTTEVVDAIGFTRQNADYRLRQLAEGGTVRRKKVRPALVWMLNEREVTA